MQTVFAAPQSPAHSFEPIADVNDVIQSKFEHILNVLKCGRTVVGDAIGESDFKEVFQQFAGEVEKIIENGIPLCRVTGNIQDEYKYVKKVRHNN